MKYLFGASVLALLIPASPAMFAAKVLGQMAAVLGGAA